MSNCTSTTLSAYVPSASMPWNRKRALHLNRRLSFGTHIGAVDEQLTMTPSQAVDEMIDAAINAPDIPVPEWAEWGWTDYESRGLTDRIFGDGLSLGFDWIERMPTGGFKEKLRLFWYNHFVVEWDSFFCSSTLYKWITMLDRNGLGNFKTFVFEVGIEPAMLIYLNGEQNNKFEPNENYARELFELFTMGADNGYTQEDIVQASRALTGWQVQNCNKTSFNANLFDNGDKEIFGVSDGFVYNTLINHIFDSKAIEVSTYICRKIYIEFVSDDVDESIVEGLAQVFRDNDFELDPVFRTLFKSEHFFDDRNIGVKVKSPYQSIIGIISEFGAPIQPEHKEQIYWVASEIGQNLFNPPDVAGWQGNRTWVDTSTLAVRWTLVELYAGFIFQSFRESLRALAKTTSDNSNDVEFVVQSIVEYLIPNGFQLDEHYNSAVAVFKGEVPQNYFDDGSWNLDWDIVPGQVALLMNHLGRQPEYQLY